VGALNIDLSTSVPESVPRPRTFNVESDGDHAEQDQPAGEVLRRPREAALTSADELACGVAEWCRTIRMALALAGEAHAGKPAAASTRARDLLATEGRCADLALEFTAFSNAATESTALRGSR